MKLFSELQLPDALHKALGEMNFTTPTPIQSQAIPIALTGRDLIGCAQTGTGKTAAFGLPLMARLSERRDQTALILVPTRELAAQVEEVLATLGKHLPDVRTAVLIGGVAMQPQIKSLRRRPRVIVATPGRLIDHLRQRTVQLDQTGILVLDEADRMLDQGFAPQLREILKFLPKQRQTLLFTATLPPDVEQLAKQYLHDPMKIAVAKTPEATPKINQQSREVIAGQKNGILLDELNAREGTVLVFARTQSRTDRVARYLEGYGVKVARIHGGRTQGQRTRALDGFRDGSVRVLVATDIAARGIDIDHVAHVINYDLPQVPEDYVHRIGRTGRAGREGQAMSLVTPEDKPNWRDIQRLLGGDLSRDGRAPARRDPHPGSKPQRSSQPQRQSQPSCSQGNAGGTGNRDRDRRGQRGDSRPAQSGGGERPAHAASGASSGQGPRREANQPVRFGDELGMGRADQRDGNGQRDGGQRRDEQVQGRSTGSGDGKRSGQSRRDGRRDDKRQVRFGSRTPVSIVGKPTS